MSLSRTYKLSKFLQNLIGLGYCSSTVKLISIHIDKEMRGMREEIVTVFFRLTIIFVIEIKFKWKQLWPENVNQKRCL
jgi:hypothetical protein